MGRFKSPVVAAIASAALTASLVGGVAIAQTSSGAEIKACVAENSGYVRIISPSDNCKANEAATTWNQTGPAGANGKTVLNGIGAPPTVLGADGDFYVDTGANAIYGPKANGAWPGNGVSLVGPSGPQGPQGVQGAQGVPGETGPAGTARAWGEWGHIQGALINGPSPNVTVEHLRTGVYCVSVQETNLAQSLGIVATMHEFHADKRINYSRALPASECFLPKITLTVRDASGQLADGGFFFIVP